jgi:C4-dicarboxylate-specific signal transduction histidine kinase
VSPQSSWSPERLDSLNRLTLVARLLSTAVHETCNSLQIISGNAELVEAQPGEAERARTRAQTIKTHADRAGLRLRALAALSAIEPDRRHPLDLRQVAERALDLRRYTLARGHVAVTLEAPGPVAVLADDRAVVRILANLVLNAETAMAGQPTRALVVQILEAEGRGRLTVTDTGPGIAPDRVARLFEPFDGDDRGCGLAVSRWLAERQGGRLTFAPPPAGGAAFVLDLPAVGRP